MVDARVFRWPMRAWQVGRCARGVIIYIFFIVLLIKRNYHNFGLTKLNSKGSVLYCYRFRGPDVRRCYRWGRNWPTILNGVMVSGRPFLRWWKSSSSFAEICRSDGRSDVHKNRNNASVRLSLFIVSCRMTFISVFRTEGIGRQDVMASGRPFLRYFLEFCRMSFLFVVQ